jgi:hypothetical protein
MRAFSWVLGVLLASAPRLASAQTCAPHVAGGVVVTEGRGGMGARLSASPQGIAVTWVEQRPYANRDFRGASGMASFFYGRVVERQTAAPRGAASLLFDQTAPYVAGMGPALAQSSDGRIASVVCTCVGGSANTQCEATTLVGTPAFGDLRPRTRQSSVCPRGPLAAAGVGAQLLVASPFPDVDGVRMYGTAVGGLQDVALSGEIDAPTMAAVGSDQALYVRRAGGAIEARLFDARGNARGRPVVLSSPRNQVGAPFALSLGESVLVAFAQRRGRDPWKIHFATYRAGGAVTHADITTGGQPAMAPSLAPSTNGCVALSWTEGTGRTTVARAGRVCNGALDASTAAQLSQPGIEAGDSEIATDGAHLYAVWQELSSARGGRAELRVARLGCR